jgi:hypothetical protein
MCLSQITDHCCTRIWASTQCSNYSSSLDGSVSAHLAIGSTLWSSTNSVAHACSVRFPFLPLHILHQSRADQILSHSVRLRRLHRRSNRRMHHRLHLPTNRPPQRRQCGRVLPLPPHRLLLLLCGRDVLYLCFRDLPNTRPCQRSRRIYFGIICCDHHLPAVRPDGI